jgi:hypothetical protein
VQHDIELPSASSSEFGPGDSVMRVSMATNDPLRKESIVSASKSPACGPSG